MSRPRQIVIQLPAPGGAWGDGPLPALGSLKDVEEAFAQFNTAPDGSGRTSGGMPILHGPGIVVELPVNDGKVHQALVNVKDGDIAFSVLWRLCRKFGWKMLDPDSGRTFG